MAQLAEISGVVSMEETKRNVMCNVTITADDGEVVTYALPYSAGIKVKEGDTVEKTLPQHLYLVPIGNRGNGVELRLRGHRTCLLYTSLVRVFLEYE